MEKNNDPSSKKRRGRGRPTRSLVRQNLIEMLFHMQRGYGYEICKTYHAIFPKASTRLIYYHLKKGLETGEFVIDEVAKEMGDYSWGTHAEKTYYKLGPTAKVHGSKEADKYFKKK